MTLAKLDVVGNDPSNEIASVIPRCSLLSGKCDFVIWGKETILGKGIDWNRTEQMWVAAHRFARGGGQFPFLFVPFSSVLF